MSDMDARRTAFENKYAYDETLRFKVEARACKLFGLWLAEEMGLNEAEADIYAQRVVAANLSEAGFNDVLQTIRPDLDGYHLDYTDNDLLARMDRFLVIAKQQIMSEVMDDE